ncbi:hypothetical protein N9J88_04060 [Porticoccaceae bacterium]|nr:hypothetical protein [Porticoccaceae bacterium]
MIIKKHYPMAVVLVSLLFIAGCSSESKDGPDDELVELGVRQEMSKHRVPKTWINLTRSGYKDPKIIEIEIVERGAMNRQQKFWPVRIRISGAAKHDHFPPLGAVRTKYFDAVSDWRFEHNNGDWQVSFEDHTPSTIIQWKGTETEEKYRDLFKRSRELCKTREDYLCRPGSAYAGVTVREQIENTPYFNQELILEYNDWPPEILDQVLPNESVFIFIDKKKFEDILFK